MKFVKGISLFFIYPAVMFTVGFVVGVWAYKFFYPGYAADNSQQEVCLDTQYQEDYTGDTKSKYSIYSTDESKLSQEYTAVSEVKETLNADTKYVLEEMDLINGTVVETVWNVPDKYLGMDREQFTEALAIYEKNPPLSETERGFVGLQILSFSQDRVVVRMDYEYVQPDEGGFFLAVYDNEVIVYLSDCKTVYMNTGVSLDRLPEDIQTKIVQMMWMPDEESLYGFLEAYSS
jgi:nuclear transport factor 2 (NTF2) superfamily protein